MTFLLSEEIQKAFHELKKSLEDAVVTTINEDKAFQVETDTSNPCIVVILNLKQRGTCSGILVSNIRKQKQTVQISLLMF